MLSLSPAPINTGFELSSFESRVKSAGAIVSFSGLVRPVAKSGRVRELFLQAFSPMTERGIEKAMAEADARWDLQALRIVHRIGNMKPGETIVFVAAASAHRRDAFLATDFLMDYLKTQAIFWKKEATENGSVWIEPRAEDHQDQQRWEIDATSSKDCI